MHSVHSGLLNPSSVKVINLGQFTLAAVDLE
jgi:hypothetical protein